jgi:hypothetical protein
LLTVFFVAISKAKSISAGYNVHYNNRDVILIKNSYLSQEN